MSLLTEIRDGAISSETRLDEVLRRCLVLAEELDSETLRIWADNELDGYKSLDEVPDYRAIAVTPKFNAANFAWKVTGQTVPIEYLPRDLWDEASEVRLTQGVSAFLFLLGKTASIFLHLQNSERQFWNSQKINKP